MASWSEIEAEVPEFAERVKARLDAGIHKTLASLRRDGSPRISGTEIEFVAGDLWFGSMPGASKARDLQRSVVGLNEDRTKMVIEHWHEGRGLERIER